MANKSKGSKHIVQNIKTEIPTYALVRFKSAIFILLFSVAVLVFISLSSFDPNDSAWTKISSENVIRNLAGTAGAYIADLLFFAFGYLAYSIPILLGLSAIQIFKFNVLVYKTKNQNNLEIILLVTKFFGIMLALITAGSIIELFINKDTIMDYPGGIVSSILSDFLLDVFSYYGSILVCLGLFFIGLTVAIGLLWIKMIAFISYNIYYFIKILQNNIFNLLNNIKKLKQNIKTKSSIKKSIDKNSQTVKSYINTTKIETKIYPSPEIKKIKYTNHSAKTNYPDIDLLENAEPLDKSLRYSDKVLHDLSQEVEIKLLDFGVVAKVVAVNPGPIITRFELELAAGTKASKISGLAKDLARSLSVRAVRVVEVIPGKSTVGLEIPNKNREIVKLKEIIQSVQYTEQESPLTLALGKDISGIPVVTDLAKMPHLLVAGTTGSGKSVGVNAMLLSILYKSTAEDVRLILIDPKMLELSVYAGIPHLLTPVVTDMKDAANALRWCVGEMERRYKVMAATGVRNLAGFNHKISLAEKNGEPLVDPLWEPVTGEEAPLLTRLPYIVVCIDEFADMIMVVGKKVEELIARIAQKARAAGIHMILATQRPSVDVITGLIKANVPTRISFQVSSRIDSRTILDQQGAEQLLGHGDMLYLAPGTGIPNRIHGAFVSDQEVHKVVKSLKEQGSPEYIEEISNSSGFILPGLDQEDTGGESDPLYDQAVSIVIESRRASISHLQRRLKIGYNRAARLIEDMESVGLVSTMQSNGTREVIVLNNN